MERFFQDNKYLYTQLNPLEAKYQTMLLRRNKTDKSDAHELAKSHFKVKRHQKYQQDDYYEEMRVLSRRDKDIESEKNLCKNRMHAFLQLSFPELEVIFKTKSTFFFNVIQIFTHPDSVLKLSKTIIRNQLKKCTRKNYSLKRLEERALQLIDAANESYPAIKEKDYQCDLTKSYAQRILELEEEQNKLINRMAIISESKDISGALY